MAVSSTFFILTLLILLFTCNFYVINGCYTSIISFGDSLADTGNCKLLSINSDGRPLPFLFPPYGQNFFHKPTGRCSNGRLIIDFLAESLGLPLIPPYQAVTATMNVTGLGEGVNYAVAGATALDPTFHIARGVNVTTNASLGVQLGWFKESLSSISPMISDVKHLVRHSLILMGEIGGNDYNHALESGKSIEEVETYVPFVISTIISAVNELINVGAKTVVVPGNLPIGCSATYLTMFYGSYKVHYDKATGCIIELNEFAEYHNQLLKTELNRIQELHPKLNIIYADYYNAAMQVFVSPHEYGFTNGALKACCGGGGAFNYNSSIACSNPLSTLCAEPDTYFNWDGLHLTEAAYKNIFKSLFEGPYTSPQFSSLCPTSRSRKIGRLSSSI